MWVYLINLSPNHLLGVVAIWHEHFDYVHQTPEGILLIKKKKSNSSHPVKTLAVFYHRIVQAVCKKDTPQLWNA